MDLRCFIAIEIPVEVKNSISEAISPLKKLGQDSVKWVRPENIHLTLKFLGNTPEDRLKSIEAALTRACMGMNPIEGEIKGAGAFPNPGRPSVLWVGLECPPALLELKERIESELGALGFEPDDRPFSPHLTVGRVKRGMRLPKRRLFAAIEQLESTSFGTIDIREIALMKSDLRPGGPVYTRIFSAGLSGS